MSLTMSPLQTRNGSSQPLEAFAIAPPEPSGSPSSTRSIARPGGEASPVNAASMSSSGAVIAKADAIEAVAAQCVEQVGEERAVEDRDELLRRPPRERAQPRPLPADQHYRAHGRDRTRRLGRRVSSRAPTVILAATWRSSTAVTRENGCPDPRGDHRPRRLSTGCCSQPATEVIVGRDRRRIQREAVREDAPAVQSSCMARGEEPRVVDHRDARCAGSRIGRT